MSHSKSNSNFCLSNFKQSQIVVNQLQNPIQSNLDLQYHVCAAFLRHTGKQLRQKQIHLMQQSRCLIQKLQQKITNSKQSTQLSLTKDNSHCQRILERQQSLPEIKRVLSRTRLHNNNLKKTGQYCPIALREIQQNCSKKTHNFIVGIIDQHKKMAIKNIDLQKKQSMLRKKKDVYQQTCQQNIMQKIYYNRLKNQIKQLENNIKLIQQQFNNYKLKQNPQTQNHIYQNGLKQQFQNFLLDKEKILDIKAQKLYVVDKCIIDNLTGKFNSNQSCTKCCGMIKRLKESIMKYKEYMDNQMVKVDEYYQKYKNLFIIEKIITKQQL